MASTIQVRVDDDLKAKSDAKRANADPYEALKEHEILDKLEKSREHAAQGMYKEAAENVLNDYDKSPLPLPKILPGSHFHHL